MKTIILKRAWVFVACVAAVAMTACNPSSQEDSKAESQIQSPSESQIQAPSDSQLPTDSLNFDNMDLSRAKITVPECDEYHRLEFACQTLSASSSFEAFQEAYELYFGETITTAEMMAFGEFSGIPEKDIINVYSYDQGAVLQDLDVRFDALPEQQFPSVRYVRAENDRCYMDLNRAFMFEIYDRKFITELLGTAPDCGFSWRPFSGSSCGVKSVDEDCTYSLYGTDISLQDALTFAEDYFSNHDLGRINSSLFTYRRDEAEVYRYGETNYGYYMRLKPCYNGVPVGSYPAAFSIDREVFEEGMKVILDSEMKCLMVREDKLDWIWTCGLTYDAPTKKEVYAAEDLLTMEEAAVLASEALTDGITFKITKVQLYYAYGEMYEVEDGARLPIPKYLFIEPTWQFVMPANSSMYNRIVVEVSAINGDVVVRYE